MTPSPWLANTLLGVGAFAITVAETYLGTKQTRAISESRIFHAAHWAALFELVLVLDVWFIVEARWLVAPIVVGAWCGVILTKRRG